ncbi:MAG: ring hydroxylating beta subunit [Ramlibacter sp.]|nr:ring hydroxylating beta subunit [Ramlibacter sp.]
MTETQSAAAAVAPADLERIRDLLTAFAWFADRGDGDGLSRLFLPEGVLHVGGQDLVGREQIGRDCIRRAALPGRKARHVWSNLRIEGVEVDRISTTAVQLTFEQVDEQGSASTHLRVNDLFDNFTGDGKGGWHFARRRIERAMALVL